MKDGIGRLRQKNLSAEKCALANIFGVKFSKIRDNNADIRPTFFYCFKTLLAKFNPFWLLQHMRFSFSLERRAWPNETGF